MRRIVFCETRNAVAASATVSRGAKESSVRDELASAELVKQCDACPGGVAGATWSNASEAQDGIAPEGFDADSLQRREAGGRSPDANFGMALPMPTHYSARKPPPIP
jgi:hypothetical protein